MIGVTGTRKYCMGSCITRSDGTPATHNRGAVGSSPTIATIRKAVQYDKRKPGQNAGLFFCKAIYA